MGRGSRNCIGTGKEVTLNITPRSVFKSCVTCQIIMVSESRCGLLFLIMRIYSFIESV